MSKETETTKAEELTNRIASQFSASRFTQKKRVVKDILAEALQQSFSDGYAAGHEDQMRARIMDAQERRNAKN
jgi:hypothetical protein